MLIELTGDYVDLGSLKQQTVLLCLLLILMAGHASAEVRNGTIGEVIGLSGTAPGFYVVYLFMTGPGVPQYGSRMDSSVSPVVTGDPDSFTQVVVDGDRWNYSWQTGRVSGGLAPGLYTVYASTAPVAADALSGIPYSETDVFLSKPVTTGTFHIQSVPPGAQVEVNGKYSGNAPLDLPDLVPGTYLINISLQGYVPENGVYDLSAGETKQISVELKPALPSATDSPLPLTTIPETMAGTAQSPTRAPLSSLIVIGSLVIGLGMMIGLIQE
ncbi:MAG TPA: PEGA domain-containing protein [Methanoregulaceae archaeon]|nr:PEGA domain-containing protein [Methanoregulaceae archaeon]HQM56742.1 PEGA domain-containing protein [Methanoregulaceae archaeon]